MKHILTIIHRRTHTQRPCAHTHLQRFTLIDKQHTRTPTRRRESTQFSWPFSAKLALARCFYAPLQCLYHSASSALPTSIIPHTAAPQVNACMHKSNHIGDTKAQRDSVCAHSSQNESVTKKQKKRKSVSVHTCLCPSTEARPALVRSCQEPGRHPGPFDYLLWTWVKSHMGTACLSRVEKSIRSYTIHAL